MAIPMALGPFMFHSLRFGYNGIRRDLSTRWAEIPTVGGLNRIQWTGGDDDGVQIEGVIFPHEFGGLATLEGVRGAAAAGAVLPLITLAGNVYGMHVIEGVSEDQSFHDALGRPRLDVFRLRLRRYSGGGFSPLSVVATLFG
jgi:phage protein U